MQDSTWLSAARSMTTPVALLMALAIPPQSARAQNYGGRGGGMGGGSTVQGDIARGQGIYLQGLGQYNLSTAMATSVNTDTAIRWNQYVYLSLQESLRNVAIRTQRRKENNIRSQAEIAARLRDAPESADVQRGDALNAILLQLMNPRIDSATYRRATVPLAGDTVRKIPFHFARRQATFSMNRLTGNGEWPVSLRGTEFVRERKGLKAAIDNAIDKDVEGKLVVEHVRAIQTAIDDLDNRIEQVIPQGRADDYKQAKQYVRSLKETPRILKENAVEKVIAEIDTYPGTSVADLIRFMQKHNLYFGVADLPEEKEFYADLYASLRQQREQLGSAIDAPGAEGEVK